MRFQQNILCLLAVWAFVGDIYQAKEASYFTAAVFEHARLGRYPKDSPQDIVRMNLKMYDRATKTASLKGADIIVFPEYGIFPELSRKDTRSILETVPDPKERICNPCEQGFNSTMLYTLSCIAKKYGIVVVANMGDKQICHSHEKCREDGVFLYNANVAFDRDGTILSRYHKEHLFFEEAMDIPQKPQVPVFETDFGIFAMFICFDSIFKHITDIAQKPYIDAVLLPTEWLDYLPYLSANAYWQAWATGNNITMLTANGQYPYQGSIGSGIFTANLGALKYTKNPDGLSKLIVSRVPRSRYQTSPFSNPNADITVITENATIPYNEDGKDIPEYCSSRYGDNTMSLGQSLQCKQPDTATLSKVKLTQKEGTVKLCHNEMCCSLRYSADIQNETYYFAVFNGTHNALNKYFFTEEICFISRCDDVNGISCSRFMMKSNTVFKMVEITANFSTKFVYPSAVHSGMRLAARTQWDYGVTKISKGSYSGHIKYNGDGSSLLTVGLYGRNYDRDPPYK